MDTAFVHLTCDMVGNVEKLNVGSFRFSFYQYSFSIQSVFFLALFRAQLVHFLNETDYRKSTHQICSHKVFRFKLLCSKAIIINGLGIGNNQI